MGQGGPKQPVVHVPQGRVLVSGLCCMHRCRQLAWAADGAMPPLYALYIYKLLVLAVSARMRSLSFTCHVRLLAGSYYCLLCIGVFMSIPDGLSHAVCRNVGARHDLSCAAQAPALPVETPPAELHALHAATVSACVCADCGVWRPSAQLLSCVCTGFVQAAVLWVCLVSVVGFSRRAAKAEPAFESYGAVCTMVCEL